MERLSFKVPQKNKQVFLSPSGNKISSLLAKNKKIFGQYSFTILNQPFREVREKSRKEVVKEALSFSNKFDPDIAEKINPAYQYIIQSGHQPVFFHPGIWIKNIFLNKLIKFPLPDKSLGLNIVLDNDVCKDLNLSLPALSSSGNLKLEKVNFLSSSLAPNLPFEEYPCPSLEMITKFNQDIIHRLKLLESENKDILNNFKTFSRCLENSSRICCQNYKRGNLGEFLGLARRLYEQEIEPAYLEIPSSKICDSDEFLSFFLEIIKNIESFSETYNNKLDEYRKLFKIRNRAHPSPNLIIKENLIEVPFWIWREGDQRRKIFILNEEEKNYLYSTAYGKIFLIEEDGFKSLFSLKTLLKERGLKIRPKALLLTLYNRLFISDLFIHGLGGAKYDLVTDEIIREFFKVEPPHFLVVSCTLYLNFKSSPGTSDYKISILKNKIRDLEFNPERYVDELPLTKKERNQIGELAEKKTELIKKIKEVLSPIEKRKISEEIKAINNFMVEKVRSLKYELSKKLEDEEEKMKQSKVYTFREFP
ncbi:MAG: hypothetical protein U9O91_02770, partial [Candidatus Caldatribacteriota bacterium]|nr:hypothetical protein [Candidatus Caldatribacteriota bacterium]